MPLTKWDCSSHGEVLLNHWTSSGDCQEYSPRLIASILKDRFGDKLHKGYALTPTTVMNCPRAVVLERFNDFTASPNDYITPHMGTLVHQGLDENAGDVTVAHGVKVQGQLFGHHFVGEIDALVSLGYPKVQIEEEKTINAYAMKYVPRDDHVAQVSMYKLLYEQEQEVEVESIYINYYAIGGTKGMPNHRRIKIDSPWNEAKLLNFKPGGGQYTIRENLLGLNSAHDRLAEGQDVKDVTKTLPMAGMSMYVGRKGNKCQLYCSQANVCIVEIEKRPGLLSFGNK